MERNEILKKIILKINKKQFASQQELSLALKKTAGSFKIASPQKIELISAYHKLRQQGRIRANPSLEKWLTKREIRTLSGVAVIAVLTKPYPCPGQCLFCPTEKAMPKSYLSNEPAVMRAIGCGFNPYKQVKARLTALKMTGHDTDKCELIVMGGTWSYLPHKYQTWFIKRCFEAFNGKTAKNLDQAQKLNESAKFRVIGLTLETRPDYINAAEIKRMRELGCTRVEIGVQSLDDKVLKFNQRGHSTQQTIVATKLLKDAGFKISYHMMPNLPTSTPAKDLAIFKKLFTDSNYQPDQMKIYPCVVTKGSQLYKSYQKKKYRPYTDKQLINLLLKVKKIIPPYVRISRLIRDIPGESIVAGCKVSNLRQLLQRTSTQLICQCIRCREARNKPLTVNKLQLTKRKYNASEGIEYFLSYESKDKKTLFAFLRLRLPQKPDAQLLKNFPALKDSAIIREIHTYGQLVPLKSKKQAVQHAGLGKKLIELAEKTAKQNGFKKIAVISGIGVRKYYQKLGYKLQDTYMLKNL